MTLPGVLSGAEMWTVVQGDVLDVLQGLPSDTFDFVLGDVPYGLGNHDPTPDEVLAFLSGGTLRTGDFMGSKWQIPSVEVWREVYRVAKPGAHCFSFGGTRTWDLISMGLRMAGWTNRDTIKHDHPALCWSYASGMKKGPNVGKSIGKAKGAVREKTRPVAVPRRTCNGTSALGGGWQDEPWETAPSTPEAQEWEGYGSCLAPTWEPVLVFRKPLEGTLVDNVLAHGCGALNVEACRTATDWSDRSESWKRSGHSAQPDADKIAAPPGNGIVCNPGGRYPKNTILSCECHGEHLDGCPVRLLDEQSGNRKSGEKTKDYPAEQGACYGTPSALNTTRTEANEGPASRFFPTFRADPPEPFFYCGKASRFEREVGCHNLPARTRGDITGREDGARGQADGRSGMTRKGAIRNTGKCVKPQGVLRWLARLGCRPGGLVLVPYCGTGSEMIACVTQGMRVIGIELDPEMIPIANARLAWWSEHPDGTSDEAKTQAHAEAAGQVPLFSGVP